MSNHGTTNPATAPPATTASSADRWHRQLLRFLWRPAVTFWASFGSVVFYPLSAGPACWLLWNFHLPAWSVAVMRFVYCPLISVLNKSDFAKDAWTAYADIWVDNISRTTGQSATQFGPDPVPPPYFVEVAGVLIPAFLVWSLARWINQRGLARS
jgi:hypothetical protein